MDFGSEEWDVSGDASQLVEGLFGEHAGQKQMKAKKRKADGFPMKADVRKFGNVCVNARDESAEENASFPSSKKQKKKKKMDNPEGTASEKVQSTKKNSDVSSPITSVENIVWNGKTAYTELQGKSNNSEMEQNSRKKKRKKNKAVRHETLNADKAENSMSSDFSEHNSGAKKCRVNKFGKTSESNSDAILNSEWKKSNTVPQSTDSEEKRKKKRKRKCKRNKFKDYSKDVPGTSCVSETHVKSDLEREPENNGVRETKEKASIGGELDTGNTGVRTFPGNKKKKKGKEKAEMTTKLDSSLNSEKPLLSDKKLKLEKKKKSKLPFDPHKLSQMLSPSGSSVKFSKDADSEAFEMSAQLNSTVNEKKAKGGPTKSLLERSRERLNAARFRYLNEQLYTTTGKEALQLFKKDREAFSIYHEGFQSQVDKWPANPLDMIITYVREKQRNLVVADFGCGDAKLARSVPNKVHSFDLVALNDHVTVCEMSKVPLGNSSVDIAVFCLSLMGTNLTSYVTEARRVLKNGGTLLIAEVTSRFHILGQFVKQVEKLGFRLRNQDTSNKMFVWMDFKKTSQATKEASEEIKLKPCVYKKR